MARTREEVKAARRQFAREHDGRQRDLPARRVEQLREDAAKAAQAAAELAIADASTLDSLYRFALPLDPNAQVYEKLVRLYIMQTEGFRDWLLDRVEAVAPTFTTELSIAQYQKAMGEFEDELAEAERAARAAPLIEQKAELDEQLQAIETD